MGTPGKLTRSDRDDGHRLTPPGPAPDLDKQIPTPGKTTQVGNQPAPAPGKTTEVGQQYVDHGAVCDSGGPGCFLTSAQRDRMVVVYGQRVARAEMHYVTALTNLRVDTLLEKDPDLFWVADLIIGLLSTFATNALVNTFKALRSGGGESALWALKKADASFGSLEPSAATAMAEAFNGTSDSSLSAIVKAGVDMGKKKGTAAVHATVNSEEKSQKKEKLDYITQLTDQSGAVFQHLSEDPPGYATDAALMALFFSFEEANHTVSRYQTELAEHIKRYQASFVKRIGKQIKGGGHTPQIQGGPAADKNARWQTEVKCIWLIHTSDKVPRLAYVTRDMKVSESNAPWEASKSTTEYVSDPDYHLVEKDLVDVAVSRHIEEWKAPPDIKWIDDSITPTFKKKTPNNPVKPISEGGPDRPVNQEEE